MMTKEYNVVAQIKVYVDDPSSLEAVKNSIGQIAKVQKFWEEDVGFGIKVLKATLLLSDDEGMDVVESKIKETEHVSELEIESVGRV